jgi:hypothetical protein
MDLKRQTALGWAGVIIATLFMLLTSSLILYPTATLEKLFIALRVSSLTTAIPFLLIFAVRPLTRLATELGQWIQTNRPYLWIIATISHLIHLYQIFLYYQLGQSCPLAIWAVTSPLWIILVAIALLEITQPQRLDRLYAGNATKGSKLLHGLSIWYVWLIFTASFGMSTITKHILIYNIPALILFLAGAIATVIVRRKRAIAV